MRITVVVEAKGCWNPGLCTDIKEQLAERYLVDARTTRGLYLTGWFVCAHWDSADKKRKAACPSDREALASELARIAGDLSSPGRQRIDSFVLDAALRFPAPPAKKTSTKRTSTKKTKAQPSGRKKVRAPRLQRR